MRVATTRVILTERQKTPSRCNRKAVTSVQTSSMARCRGYESHAHYGGTLGKLHCDMPKGLQRQTASSLARRASRTTRRPQRRAAASRTPSGAQAEGFYVEIVVSRTGGPDTVTAAELASTQLDVRVISSKRPRARKLRDAPATRPRYAPR